VSGLAAALLCELPHSPRRGLCRHPRTRCHASHTAALAAPFAAAQHSPSCRLPSRTVRGRDPSPPRRLSRRLLGQRAPQPPQPLGDMPMPHMRWWSTRRCTQTARRLDPRNLGALPTVRGRDPSPSRRRWGRRAGYRAASLVRQHAPQPPQPLCDMWPCHTHTVVNRRAPHAGANDAAQRPLGQRPLTVALGARAGPIAPPPPWATQRAPATGPCAIRSSTTTSSKYVAQPKWWCFKSTWLNGSTGLSDGDSPFEPLRQWLNWFEGRPFELFN
jgi:hypothetical protein